MDKDIKRAKSYSRAKHIVAIAGMLISVFFFIFLWKSGLSWRIASWTSLVSSNGYIGLCLYLLVIGTLLFIADFPLDLFSSFILEHRFGLSRQSLSSWLKDYLKQAAIGGVIIFLFILIIYALLRATYLWWLYAALIYFIFSIGLAKIFPVVIIPLFYKLTELTDSPLKERLISLAKKAGARAVNVYKIGLGEKTRKANAAVCGLGSTKRILLSDTLIQGYTEDEIEATLGHELAHYKYRHFWKLTFFSFMLTLFAFLILDVTIQSAFAAGTIVLLADFAFLPVLALVFTVYNILITPIMNFISRFYETQADREAALLTRNPGALSSLLRKLTRQNLSDPSPAKIIKFFFYTHPPAAERIRMCEKYNA